MKRVFTTFNTNTDEQKTSSIRPFKDNYWQMKTRIYFLALISLSLGFEISAQVSIDGEFRPRSEFRQGFRKPLVDTLQPSLVTLQRTRFSADYKSKILNAHITMQDARIWGESGNKTSNSKIEIYEAWSEYLIASGFSAQFGRQILNYDDQRVLGASNWSNTGLAHDVLRFKYNPAGNWQMHAGVAYNNAKDTLMEVDYPVKQTYKTMGFLWLSKTLPMGLTATAIAIEEGLQKTNDYKIVYPRFTGGVNITYNNDSSKLNFNALGYTQRGKSSTFEDLDAFMTAAKVSYKIFKSNALFVGAEYYSGTSSDTKAGSSFTFNKLYGANHIFNGNMEYWATIPKGGLVNYYGGISGKISTKISLDMTYHLFSLAEKLVINKKEINKDMGSELDIILNYKISKEIALQTGYCMYFNSSSTNDFYKYSNVDTHASQWAYLMMTIKPNFYKTPPTSSK